MKVFTITLVAFLWSDVSMAAAPVELRAKEVRSNMLTLSSLVLSVCEYIFVVPDSQTLYPFAIHPPVRLFPAPRQRQFRDRSITTTTRAALKVHAPRSKSWHTFRFGFRCCGICTVQVRSRDRRSLAIALNLSEKIAKSAWLSVWDAGLHAFSSFSDGAWKILLATGRFSFQLRNLVHFPFFAPAPGVAS